MLFNSNCLRPVQKRQKLVHFFLANWMTIPFISMLRIPTMEISLTPNGQVDWRALKVARLVQGPIRKVDVAVRVEPGESIATCVVAAGPPFKLFCVSQLGQKVEFGWQDPPLLLILYFNKMATFLFANLEGLKPGTSKDASGVVKVEASMLSVKPAERAIRWVGSCCIFISSCKPISCGSCGLSCGTSCCCCYRHGIIQCLVVGLLKVHLYCDAVRAEFQVGRIWSWPCRQIWKSFTRCCVVWCRGSEKTILLDIDYSQML